MFTIQNRFNPLFPLRLRGSTIALAQGIKILETETSRRLVYWGFIPSFPTKGHPEKEGGKMYCDSPEKWLKYVGPPPILFGSKIDPQIREQELPKDTCRLLFQVAT